MVEPVSVIITTYDNGDVTRLRLCELVLQTLLNKLRYPDIRWIVVDDSNEINFDRNKQMLEMCFVRNHVDNYMFINTNRSGVGTAKNTALRYAFELSPYVLLLEDDWLLKEPLELVPYIRVLAEDTSVGMIRLGYLGSEHETLEARYRRGLPDMPWFTFWELKRGSDVYVYSGQVSLRHKRFYDAVGYHKENDTPGEEELDMCKRYNATDNAPVILWPAWMGAPLGTGLFDNIGLGYSTNNVEPGK